MKHQEQKRLGGGKGLFHLKTLRSHSITEGSQDRKLEAGTEAEVFEEHGIVDSSSWLA